MSLTKDDLQQIRTIVQEEARTIVREETRTIVREETRTIVREEIDSALEAKVNPRLDTLEGKIEAIHNDLKDIYDEIESIKIIPNDKAFSNLTLEQQLRRLHKSLQAAAKQAGIDLSQ